eukprot:14969-Heterococcus_DN1.PRE.1
MHADRKLLQFSMCVYCSSVHPKKRLERTLDAAVAALVVVVVVEREKEKNRRHYDILQKLRTRSARRKMQAVPAAAVQ